MLGTFPTLAGLSWSTFKEPQFNTITQKAVSGRELRVQFQPLPTWLFRLKFDYLPPQDLQALMGLFIAMQGSFGQFVFVDPTDNTVANGYIVTGDGNANEFILGRWMGSFYEPVWWLMTVPTVYLNGVPFGTEGNEWNVGGFPATLAFAAPPAPGVVVTADFIFAFVCRFADDTYSFENFMHNLWSLKEIKLQSTFPVAE